ncbi:MAG TPA: sugar phosphate isomerase/epimerase [Gemmatimonadales bacterium]|nr:sugar phosphate isomerase/epimerase [Gemmatimonadales bacterium]
MERRTFVASTLGAAVPLLLPNLALPRFGAADKLDRIGLQLYTLRSAMAESVERTLKEVADIGYREVEFAGYFDRPPRAIKQLLDRNGLKSPAAHTDLATMKTNWYQTLNGASEMGQKWLVVPWLGESDRNSIDALKRTAATLNRAAEDAKTFRIRVAYHNHDFEFTDVEGRRPFDVLLEETDPKLIDFEMDLYWITKAGGDPFAYFAKWPGRFPLVHVKDAGPAPEFQMRDVGKGTIDFAKLFAARDQAGMKHFFVEHDNPADPMASVRTSYRYLDALRF